MSKDKKREGKEECGSRAFINLVGTTHTYSYAQKLRPSRSILKLPMIGGGLALCRVCSAMQRQGIECIS